MTTPTPEDDVKVSDFMERHFKHLKTGRLEYTEAEVRAVMLGMQTEFDARIARLLDHIKALERDAARYEHVRRKVCISGGKFHVLNLPNPTYIAPNPSCEFDAAIDTQRAAIASEAKP